MNADDRRRANREADRLARVAAIDRGMDNAMTRGALHSWSKGDSLGAPLWRVEPASPIVRMPTATLDTHEAELFLAGVAAGLTASGHEGLAQ